MLSTVTAISQVNAAGTGSAGALRTASYCSKMCIQFHRCLLHHGWLAEQQSDTPKRASPRQITVPSELSRALARQASLWQRWGRLGARLHVAL